MPTSRPIVERVRQLLGSRVHDEITIDAPVDVVVEVYRDVERWPEWTASVTSVELDGGRPLAIGKRAHIKQPRLPRTTWTVTVLDPERGWTWESRAPGVHTIAEHAVEPLPDGRTRAVLSLDQRGVLGRPIGWLLRRLTRRYLRMEAEGLQARSEQAGANPT